MINIDELLQPVSPTEPCGSDISYDPAMHQLETLLLGKPETQFSAAEEPEWEKLESLGVALIGRSKNLRVAMILCLALLKTEGLPGFRDGIALIRELLERYWEPLFPKLDPDDNNDPTERVNILTPLVTPLGAFDDPMQFQLRLREAKLSHSPRVGSFSLAEIVAPTGADGKAGPDAGQAEAAFRDTPPERLEGTGQAIIEAAASAREIDAFLTATIGADRAMDWAPLLHTLEELRKALAPYLSGPAAAPIIGAQPAAAGASAAAASAPAAPSGAIQSRQDVVSAIDRICEYYKRAEPSSPVPLLLQRARRLVEKGFLEIIGDLSPEALGPLHTMTGVKQQVEGEAK